MVQYIHILCKRHMRKRVWVVVFRQQTSEVNCYDELAGLRISVLFVNCLEFFRVTEWCNHENIFNSHCHNRLLFLKQLFLCYFSQIFSYFTLPSSYLKKQSMTYGLNGAKSLMSYFLLIPQFHGSFLHPILFHNTYSYSHQNTVVCKYSQINFQVSNVKKTVTYCFRYPAKHHWQHPNRVPLFIDDVIGSTSCIYIKMYTSRVVRVRLCNAT